MSDKKSCGNCAIGQADLLGCKIKSKCHDFAKWERPTYLWLDILPTELGWYFERRPGIKARMIEVVKDTHGNIAELLQDGWKSKLNAESKWQGPITPKEG